MLVTLIKKCNIFNSATSSSASCLLVSDTISNPYIIAGLTTVLYTCFYRGRCFSITDYIRNSSPIVPPSKNSFLYLITLLFIDPKYLNSATLISCTSCNCTLSPSSFSSLSLFHFHLYFHSCTYMLFCYVWVSFLFFLMHICSFLVFLYLLFALSTLHNISSKYYGPWRLL